MSKSEYIAVAQGELPNPRNVVEGHAYLGLQEQQHDTRCEIELNTAHLRPKYNWQEKKTHSFEFFILPTYKQDVFEAQILDFSSVDWLSSTPKKTIDKIRDMILSEYPILKFIGLKNIIGYTPSADDDKQIFPYLSIPSGVSIFAQPKEFWQLLGLENNKDLKKLYKLGDNHPKVPADHAFYGFKNKTGEAKTYISTSKDIFLNQVYSEFSIETITQEEEDEAADEENTEAVKTGVKRPSSAEDPVRKKTKILFGGFSEDVLIYLYFDTNPFPIGHNSSSPGRKQPRKTCRIDVNYEQHPNDLVTSFDTKLNLQNIAKTLFDNSLAAPITGDSMFQIKTQIDSITKKWTLSLSLKPKVGRNISHVPENFKIGIQFQVYINQAFARFLGYDIQPKQIKVGGKGTFFSFKKINTLHSNLESPGTDVSLGLFKNPFPLFICLRDSLLENLELYSGGKRMSVVGTINSPNPNDISIFKGHSINIDRNRLQSSNIFVEIIDQNGLPLSFTHSVFLTFKLSPMIMK